MKFLSEHRSLTQNKTLMDANKKQEMRNNDGKLQQLMAPWLLPVLVAVIMLVFLVISFLLHHKRLVKHRRRMSQYYTLRYHRVAGPIYTCMAVDLDCDNNIVVDDMKPAATPFSITKNTFFSFRNKHGRYNTWSPRIFKDKIVAHIAHKKRLTTLKNHQNEILQIVDQLKNVSDGENQDCEEVSRLRSLLTGQQQLTSCELMSLADLTGLTRSYSCRARAVGVTTYTGTLAIAERHEDNGLVDVCDAVIPPACISNLMSSFRNISLASPTTEGDHQMSSSTTEDDHQMSSPFEKVASPCFSNSLTQQISENFVFNFDVNDDMFNAMSRKVSQATLPRYLEDDWTCPAAYAARPYIHLARSISSYDEGEEYTAERTSDLVNLQHLFDSHNDGQPAMHDTGELVSNLAVNNRISAEYDQQSDVGDQLESSRDEKIKTDPNVDTAACEPDPIPTTNHSSESANTLIATLSFSHLGRYTENILSSNTHRANTRHAKRDKKCKSEINVNTCTEEQLLSQRTTCTSHTHGTLGCRDVILTGSGDDCQQLGSLHSLHTFHDQCCNSCQSTYRHLEELSQTNNFACSEEDDCKNRQRHLSAIRPSEKKGEFSQCSVFVTSSDKVDLGGNWSRDGVDDNFNHIIASRVREDAFSSDVNSGHGSVAMTGHSDRILKWHTSMKRSSTDIRPTAGLSKDMGPTAGLSIDMGPTVGLSGQATAGRPCVISLSKLGQTDLTSGHRLYHNRNSLSDTDIHSLPFIDRQRGARKGFKQQKDRSASLFCESWEDGVDRDYMDKSLVSLHKFVGN